MGKSTKFRVKNYYKHTLNRYSQLPIYRAFWGKEIMHGTYISQHGKSAYVKIEVKNWEYGIFQFKLFLLLKVFFDLIIILHA